MQVKDKLKQVNEEFNKQLRELQEQYENDREKIISYHNSEIKEDFLIRLENCSKNYECGFIDFEELLASLKEAVEETKKELI